MKNSSLRQTLLVVAVVTACAGESERPPRAGAQDDSLNAPAPIMLSAARRESADSGDPHGERSYVARTFYAQIGEIPRMGWLWSQDGFLATERHPSIAIYGHPGLSLTASFRAPVAAAEIAQMRRERSVACEQPDAQVVAYRLQADSSVEGFDRALYTARQFPAGMRSGMVTRPLDAAHIRAVTRLLQWPLSGILRRDEAVGVDSEGPFYSIHRRYDQTGLAVEEEALVLHRASGAFVAYDHTYVNPDELCDGCTAPSFSDGWSYAYRIENIYDLPGFAYPVLLLNTSTVEGRALSLLTFTPAARLSEFRVYEYVVQCGD